MQLLLQAVVTTLFLPSLFPLFLQLFFQKGLEYKQAMEHVLGVRVQVIFFSYFDMQNWKVSVNFSCSSCKE